MYALKGDEYEKLYEPYLRRNPLDLFGSLVIKDKRVLDLCCGTGRLAKAAHGEGATVFVVDESKEMYPWDWTADMYKRGTPVGGLCQSVHGAFETFRTYHTKFDFVACRQAVNYWFDPIGARSVFDILNPGGWFVFNTFNTAPSATPTVKQLHDEKITEVSYLVNGMVHHVQTRAGCVPHHTTFPWIAPSAFEEALTGAGFSAIADVRGRTTIWRAQKP